jgi:plasmid stabilization system protein ParE
MKNLSNEELYFKETGDKATYRKDSSNYHTLKYVHWLEAKLNRLDEVEKDNKTAELEEQSKKLENAIEMVCKEIMGEERYGNSPCQAHPLQILEVYIKEKIAELEEEVELDKSIIHNQHELIKSGERRGEEKAKQRIAELEAQVENMKRESKLLENILNYVWSVPIRQRCAIWNDINKVCSDWQSDNLT